MGTIWRTELLAAPEWTDASLRGLIEGELDRLDAQMSHWRSDSDLTRYNTAAAGCWVALPPDLFCVLTESLRIAEESEGAFDAAIGPLVDAWGFGPSQLRVTEPIDQAGISDHTKRRQSKNVQLDPGTQRALQPGGVLFDLSSIAKGFAVDRISEVLNVPGVSSTLAEIGGELRGRGVKWNGEPWWVAVESPPDAIALPETVVALSGLSIASSGDYRRFFEHQGLRYSHTIDPRTGWPIEHSVAIVTVVHEQCMLADAYSTAIAVLGAELGMEFANRHGIAARLLLRENGGFGVLHSHRSRRCCSLNQLKSPLQDCSGFLERCSLDWNRSVCGSRSVYEQEVVQLLRLG